jgi:hypothetical protein
MRGGGNFHVRRWFQCHGLLDKAVEQFASTARSASIEAEGELVFGTFED